MPLLEPVKDGDKQTTQVTPDLCFFQNKPVSSPAG